MAAVTHPHLKLEAHEGDGGALGRTFAAHGLATLPAVVLRKTCEAKYAIYEGPHFLLVRQRIKPIVAFGPSITVLKNSG